MEVIILSAAITIFTEFIKFLHRRFTGSQLEFWAPHAVVFVLSILAVIVMKVAPPDFLEAAWKMLCLSIGFYELIWKRVAVPAIDSLK